MGGGGPKGRPVGPPPRILAAAERLRKEGKNSNILRNTTPDKILMEIAYYNVILSQIKILAENLQKKTQKLKKKLKKFFGQIWPKTVKKK